MIDHIHSVACTCSFSNMLCCRYVLNVVILELFFFLIFKIPTSPNPQMYTGNYSNFFMGEVTIFEQEDMLMMHLPTHYVGNQTVYLSYHDDHSMQLVEPRVIHGYCFYHEVFPALKAWVYFDDVVKETGKIPGLRIPGDFGELHFTRK